VASATAYSVFGGFGQQRACRIATLMDGQVACPECGACLAEWVPEGHIRLRHKKREIGVVAVCADTALPCRIKGCDGVWRPSTDQVTHD
jgi:hypothetical protein